MHCNAHDGGRWVKDSPVKATVNGMQPHLATSTSAGNASQHLLLLRTPPLSPHSPCHLVACHPLPPLTLLQATGEFLAWRQSSLVSRWQYSRTCEPPLVLNCSAARAHRQARRRIG